MGYRHYFFIAKKDDVEKARKLSFQEMKEKFENEYEYIRLCDVIKHDEVFGFGKLYWDDTAEQIYNTGIPLFSDEKCMEEFVDYVPYEVGKEGVLKAIEIYKEKAVRCLKEFYKQLEKKENENHLFIRQISEKIEQIIRIFEGNYFVNLDEDEKYEITQYSKYEFQILNLVHLLKMVDWETETIIFYGW